MNYEPIIYHRYGYDTYPVWPAQRYLHVFANDDKDEFLRLIKDPQVEKARNWTPIITIFRADALEIAMAVFDGETKGIIDPEDVFKDGLTPIHLAAYCTAPRLIKYLLQMGHKADAELSNYIKHELQHSNPLDISLSTIFVPEKASLFRMLWLVCLHYRMGLEAIRILVQSMPDKKRARRACFKYARQGELRKLVALFLADPELLLSSPKGEMSLLSKLQLELENNTLTDKQLPLLLDVFALAGHELAAYIRLKEFGRKDEEKDFMNARLEIDFFLREVARKKPGVPSPDYYFSFFEVRKNKSPYKPEWYLVDDNELLPDLDAYFADVVGSRRFDRLPHLLTREDVDRIHLYRLLPSLEHQDAAYLARLVKKKISSVASHGSLKTIAKTSKLPKKEEILRRLEDFPTVPTRILDPTTITKTSKLPKKGEILRRLEKFPTVPARILDPMASSAQTTKFHIRRARSINC